MKKIKVTFEGDSTEVNAVLERIATALEGLQKPLVIPPLTINYEAGGETSAYLTTERGEQQILSVITKARKNKRL